MGHASPPDLRERELDIELAPDAADARAWAPAPPPARPRWRYLVLFLLTALTTSWAGASHYAAFLSELGAREVELTAFQYYANGLWYSASILAILVAHEFGHFFACRYYRVNATLPYFIPFPIALTGTLGAVIRIRSAIPGKRALFDIGIAGPIAGFVVAVPVLLVGMTLSNIVAVPEGFQGLELGEPLLFRAAAWLVVGAPPEGASVNMHPMVFAAWFGMLATALNLFPIGQLDGGHIAYAVLGRLSTVVTIGTFLCLVALTFFSLSWLVWTLLAGASIVALGPRHPRTTDEAIPLDRARRRLALFAVVMFVVCFTPAPVELLGIGN
jgi:membrane-associated protease RseP (regulator of RpoE activity)